MPCYLFTFHAYGTWMPDRAQGYVRRRKGILPSDVDMAKLYRQNANHDAATISVQQQFAAISLLQEAATHIDCRLHFVATDPTHIHVLVSWKGPRRWKQNRMSLKRALTIRFKERFGDRRWLSEGASRKRVRERRHFEYLVARYLPSHAGWKWCERHGFLKPGGWPPGET